MHCRCCGRGERRRVVVREGRRGAGRNLQARVAERVRRAHSSRRGGRGAVDGTRAGCGHASICGGAARGAGDAVLWQQGEAGGHCRRGRRRRRCRGSWRRSRRTERGRGRGQGRRDVAGDLARRPGAAAASAGGRHDARHDACHALLPRRGRNASRRLDGEPPRPPRPGPGRAPARRRGQKRTPGRAPRPQGAGAVYAPSAVAGALVGVFVLQGIFMSVRDALLAVCGERMAARLRCVAPPPPCTKRTRRVPPPY
jgi:hypothetical protein